MRWRMCRNRGRPPLTSRPPFFLVASLPSTLPLRPASHHASKSPHPRSLKKESVCTERKFVHRDNPEVPPVPLPVPLPTLLPNPGVPTPPLLLTHLTPPTLPSRLPSLTRRPRRKRATVRACWPKWPPLRVPSLSARPSDMVSPPCSSEAEVDTVSPLNRALPFNNSNRPSSSPESAVMSRPKVRSRSWSLVCPGGMLIYFLHVPVVIDFTKCLETADVQSCSWFLDQLKAVSPMFDARWL